VNPVHHIELWTNDLTRVEESFRWLFVIPGLRRSAQDTASTGALCRRVSFDIMVMSALRQSTLSGWFDRTLVGAGTSWT